MSSGTSQSERPDDLIDIGDECFGLRDGSVLCWRGQNYTPQVPTLRVRLHNLRVGFINRYREGQDAASH